LFPWQPSTYGWILTLGETAANMALLCGLYNSLVFDFLLRSKLSQPSIPQGTFEQVQVVSRRDISHADAKFLGSRVLALSCVSVDMDPFLSEVLRDQPEWDTRDPGMPRYRWQADARAWIRAELDAWFAHLYGLTRDELRYVLDPADVMGEDYPSETFRVLKKNEIAQYGEYRTARRVLAAWDRLVEPTRRAGGSA
jgi:hypothetical protein